MTWTICEIAQQKDHLGIQTGRDIEHEHNALRTVNLLGTWTQPSVRRVVTEVAVVDTRRAVYQGQEDCNRSNDEHNDDRNPKCGTQTGSVPPSNRKHPWFRQAYWTVLDDGCIKSTGKIAIQFNEFDVLQ